MCLRKTECSVKAILEITFVPLNKSSFRFDTRVFEFPFHFHIQSIIIYHPCLQVAVRWFFSTAPWCLSLLGGLESCDALADQVAEAHGVILEHPSDSVGLRAAHVLLISRAHRLERFDLLGLHALGEGIVGLDPGHVGVVHLDCFYIYLSLQL